MDMTDHIFAPGLQSAGPGHVDTGHSHVAKAAHQQGHGPVDLGSGKIVIELQQQHAVLPARPRVEEETSQEDGPEDDPEKA
jgi:hypothetical protein